MISAYVTTLRNDIDSPVKDVQSTKTIRTLEHAKAKLGVKNRSRQGPNNNFKVTKLSYQGSSGGGNRTSNTNSMRALQ